MLRQRAGLRARAEPRRERAHRRHSDLLRAARAPASARPLAPAASAVGAASASAAARAAPDAPPPIPDSLLAELSTSSASWLRHCVQSPLVDAATRSRVHVLGVAHYAPAAGGAAGLEQLRQLVRHLQPSVVAIEAPYDLAAAAGLPVPEVLQLLAAALPAGGEVLAAPLPPLIAGATRADLPAVAAADGGGAGGVAAAVTAARLAARLPGLAPQPAPRLGRDLLDPYEVLGLYGSCDYVIRPAQLATALGLFGFMPGLELAAAAAAGEDAGAQVFSVDAPLRLQEKWAAQAVAEFALHEADLPRRLAADLAAARALLPADFDSWDVQLAGAVRRAEAAAAAAAQAGSAAAAAAAADGPARGEGGAGPPPPPPGEPSVTAVTAFKVSRAVAAAAVPYDRARAAFALQASLQPLKYALFVRRARHLVLQVRDLCQRMTVRRVRVDAVTLDANRTNGVPAPPSPSGQQQGQQEEAPGVVDVGGEQVVLAVVGRQYVPYMEDMWSNPRSALWHGDVPRTFAPSRLQRFDTRT